MEKKREREREGEESSEESDGDGVCDYEKLRMENIRKNHSMLRSLGQYQEQLE